MDLSKIYSKGSEPKKLDLNKIYGNYNAGERVNPNAVNGDGNLLSGAGYLGGKLGTGALSILEGVWDATAGGVATIFDNDEYKNSLMENQWTGDMSRDLDHWYNPSSGMTTAGDVASAIGSSLVGIGVTALSGGSALPAMAISMVSSAGGAMESAYEITGELGAKEFAYGAMSGVVEGGLGSLIGGVGKMFKSVGKTAIKQVAKQGLVSGAIKEGMGEAFEEGLTTIIDPYLQRMTVDENAKNATIQEVGYSSLVGGLSGGIMGGTIGTDTSNGVVQQIANTKSGEKLVSQGKAQGVIENAKAFMEYEVQNNTGVDGYAYLETLVDKYSSLEIKNIKGEPTTKQKALIGEINKVNTVLTLMPNVLSSANTIKANADILAPRLNQMGLKDSNGKSKFQKAQWS